ncbi:hypothetical protein [Algicola sagamiensis]|uniref:hypothetical protein n=1 Tax=Algicola sagamiensis TaxID=163869 RepID=UPI00037FEC58|nr:hypothetical protein [Algicola sagamiensis]
MHGLDIHTGVRLGDYQTAVANWLTGHKSYLSSINTDAKSFDTQSKGLNAFLDIHGWHDFQSVGNGQYQAMLQCSLVLSCPRSIEHAQTLTCDAAMDLCVSIQDNHFGQPTEPPSHIQAFEDAFDPHMDAFVCWRVEWQQVVQVGVDMFVENGTPPEHIYFSESPNTGTDHEDDYQRI